MTRARSLSRLGNSNALSVSSDLKVGVNSTSPTEQLHVVGVVSATSFFGDGSNLQGVASAGLGTALSDVDTEANSVIYYTDTTLGIGSTVVVDPPSTTTVAYTQYQEINLEEDVDLIVAEGDDFVPDILGLGENSMTFGITGGGSGSGGSSGISNVAADTTPALGGNLDLNSKSIIGNGNININGTFTGDGSGLTGVTGTGSGIGVSDSGSSVGTAQTINFGSGLSITTVNAGFATVTLSSDLVVTGFSTFNAIRLGDGNDSSTNNIKFGADDDLEIYHNGSHAFLQNDTGNVYLRSSSGTSINIEPAAGASAIIANAGSDVELYHDNSKKFETAADGVNITGIASASTHVSSGIVTYYGDSSYAAAGRWVLGASGSDHYTFTGPGLGHSTLNDPTLYLMRGQTYMFENKMNAHPFRIQITSNGSTGAQWNVGVTNNDVSNGVLIFEVPFNCPNTLYYQCTAHANMGGALNIVT